MDDRWSTLKRSFEEGQGELSTEQLRALRSVPGSRPAWEAAEVRPASEREAAVAQQRMQNRAPRSAAAGGDTWVVTSADSKFWPFLTCFIASLRDVAFYGGRVAVIDYGLTENQRRRLVDHEVVIVQPRREHLLVIDRYFTLAEYFQDNRDDTVLYFDADIWFADSIAEVFANHGILTGKLGAAKDVWKCDYYLRCTHAEHHATVRQALTEIIRDYGQTLQAGFIAGSTGAWSRYASLMRALLSEGFAKNTWGTDALCLNFYAELYKEHFVLLPITYNAPPLWGVVREGTRFFATKFDTDSLHSDTDGRIPVKAIHCTSAVRHRTDLGLNFGDVYPKILEEWSRRLGS